MSSDESSKLYAKITIFLKDTTVVAVKTKQNMNSDNSKEHKFMLNGDSVENYKVKIQLKKSTFKWMKSKFAYIPKRIC